PSAQTCPECGGAMRRDSKSGLTLFCCHTGHQMTAEILAAAQLEVLEHNLGSVLRLLNERGALCRDMAEKCLLAGHGQAAEGWRRAAEETLQREAAAKM